LADNVRLLIATSHHHSLPNTVIRSRGALALSGLAAFLSASLGARAGAQDSSAVHTSAVFDLHGYLQVYYRSGDPITKDGFRLRKADLKFSGDVSPRLRWRIGFDAAKVLTVSKTISDVDEGAVVTDVGVDERTRILQDAALTYMVNPWLQLDIGQQVVPLSYEGTIPSSQVETIERTLFIVERSRAGGLGDVRDVGVSANGKAFDMIEYHVGTFNETGESAGTTDANDQKSIMGRVALHAPNFPQLQIGGSGSAEGGATTQRRERAAGEAQFRDEHVTIRGEVISARDGLLRRFGWYGLSAVRPTTRLQLVARFDTWDRDRSRDASLSDALEHQYVLGGSYLLDPVSRFAVNLVRQTFPTVTTVRSGTFLLVSFQGVW
jgi:hypothetical protein